MNDSPSHPEAAPAAAPPPPTAPPAASPRHRNLKILAGVVAVCAVGYASYWYRYARYLESTDDCYVNGDVVQITTEIPGTVIQLHADDTQSVARGQTLLELDPADAEVAVSNAEANLARAVRSVRALFAQADQFRAEIRDREVDLRQAEQDHDRRTGLIGDGAISSEELQHTQDRINEVRASVTAVQQQLNETTAQIDRTTVPTHPQVLAAIAAVRDASLALRRTRVTAPVSGVIAQRSVQVGQRVAAGPARMGEKSCLTETSSACRRAAVLLSPSCRLKMPPAIGSRSCSACRCASSSIRANCVRIRCASGCLLPPMSRFGTPRAHWFPSRYGGSRFL